MLLIFVFSRKSANRSVQPSSTLSGRLLIAVSAMAAATFVASHAYFTFLSPNSDVQRRRSAIVSFNIGVSSAQNGDFQTALKHFQDSLTIDPSMTIVHYRLGLTYYNMNDYRDAEAEFCETLRTGHNIHDCHIYLGNALQYQGRHAEAQTEWLLARQTEKHR